MVKYIEGCYTRANLTTDLILSVRYSNYVSEEQAMTEAPTTWLAQGFGASAL